MDDLLYLSRQDVEDTDLDMPEIIEAVETMFCEKGHGNYQMPPKPGIFPRPDSFCHAMPAYFKKYDSVGMKWSAGYPTNNDRGLSYINGLIILNDASTGLPFCVMDSTWITAMRTGAATAVAAKYLARQDSRTVGVVACGAQGKTNVRALCSLFDLEEVKAYDLRPDVADDFANRFEDRFQVKITPVSSVQEAVEGLDIIVTSGPISLNPTPSIRDEWLTPGSFACLLDFDSYWQSTAMEHVEKLATDDRNQLNYKRGEGFFKSTPDPYAEISDLALERLPRRETPFERTMCINLGLALADMAIAPLVYERAKSLGIGTSLQH